MNKKNQSKEIEIPLLQRQESIDTTQMTSEEYLESISKLADTEDRYILNYSKFDYYFFMDVSPYVEQINKKKAAEMTMNDIPLPYAHYNVLKKTAQLDKEWSKEMKKPNPSLVKALYRTYTKEFYASGVMMMVVFLGRIYSTMSLGKTINYISKANVDENLDQEGILMQATYFAIVFFATNVFNTYYWNYIIINAAKVRLSISALMYKKLQGVALSSVQDVNIGKVINLLANDLNDIEMVIQLWPVILCPVNLIITTYLMWEYFEFYTILCLVGLVGTVFISNYISRLTQKPRSIRNGIVDDRIKATNELIDCIRLIKMYSWEKPIRTYIEKLRSREYEASMKLFSIEIFGSSLSEQAVYICAFVMFGFYTIYGGGLLTPEKVYAFIMVLAFVKMWCILFPHYGLIFIANSKVLQKRVQDILLIPDVIKLGKEEAAANSIGATAIEMRNFTAYWKKGSEKPCISNITVSFKPGQVVSIIGKVGSGKTSFLLSLLREVPDSKGDLLCRGSIAYVEQEPIIFSGTVRENILFGLPYDQDLYDYVVKSCSLIPDFKVLRDGDLTRIGERGVNISGGQKARLSLARALYSKSDIYLLDDPLSAVDAKVARHLFDNAIKGDLLKNRIVILVTHHISFAKESDRIIAMHEGQIQADGTFEQLQSKKIELLDLFSKENSSRVHRKNLRVAKHSVVEEKREVEENVPKKFKEELTMVTWSSYVNYLKSSDKMTSFIIVFVFYVAQYGFFVAWNRFMGYWAYKQQEYFLIHGNVDDFDNLFFIWLGLFLTFGYFISRYFKTWLTVKFFLETNTKLHAQMLHKIIRSATSFFDRTPVGTILNRFSTDLGQLDRLNWMCLQDVLGGLIGILVMTAVVVAMNPWVFGPCILISWALTKIRDKFAKPLQEAKRMDLASKSPLYSEISGTLHGLLIIRTFRQGGRFIKNFLELIYNNSRALIFQQRTQRHFGMLLDMWLCTLTIAGIYIYIYISFNSLMEPGLFGLALSLLLDISSISSFFVKQTLQLDLTMQSAERVLNYCKLPEEAPTEVPEADNKIADHFTKWPSRGQINFKNVWMRYSSDLPFVLQGLNFQISPGMKVGCVGRTGAGKSSIVQVLFRMFEIEDQEGCEIEIDGVNIKTLGLEILRKNLSIIPQTATIFTGTIRRNLDPFNQFSEQKLWDVLKEVNLKSYVEKLEKKLDTDMTVSTTVFSSGQKQLVCLARAILRESKIIILDEATANVDMGTDNFIQDKINEKFKKCTVLTIAHRLTTIANYDKILVMDKGRAVEYDHPFLLLVEKVEDTHITKKDGIFAQMVKNTGKSMAKKIFEISSKSYEESILRKRRMSPEKKI